MPRDTMKSRQSSAAPTHGASGRASSVSDDAPDAPAPEAGRGALRTTRQGTQLQGGTMSGTRPATDHVAEASGATPVPMRFEVTTLPIADVDRAKAFYQRLGWRLDIDFKPSPDTRGVQFTPPGSAASIQFGEGTTTMTPGSLDAMILVVDGQGPGAGPRPGAPLVLQPSDVQRPRRQRVAAAGDHRAAPRPGVTMDVAALAGVLRAAAGGRPALLQGGRPAT
jgi:catechol 2,3-dioxygenase-like lactoylglutathione lyase family enzyme